MEPASQAENYFHEWKSNPTSGYRFVAGQVRAKIKRLRECEWLDFKTASPLWFRDGEPFSPEKRRAEVKRTLSELLSAFGNVSGGLIIWGINAPCRAPKSLSLAEDVEELKSIIEEQVRECTDPPLQGVECLALAKNRATKKGIVVVWVPEGKHRPYRATTGERTFWMRTQDSCDPIPTSMVRTMFFPEVRPRCEVIAKCDVHRWDNNPDQLRPSLSFKIRNAGSGSAENILIGMMQISMGLAINFYPDSGSELVSMERLIKRKETLLHPGDIWTVGGFGTYHASYASKQTIIDSKCSFCLTIYARDCPPSTWRGSVLESEFSKLDNISQSGLELKMTSAEVESA